MKITVDDLLVLLDDLDEDTRLSVVQDDDGTVLIEMPDELSKAVLEICALKRFEDDDEEEDC